MDPGRKPVKPAAGIPAKTPVKSGAKPAVRPAAKPAPDATASMTAKGFLQSLRDGGGGDADENTVYMLRQIILVLSLVILVLTLSLTYAKFKIPRDPIPFAINIKDGKPKIMRGLKSPTLTQQAIMSWVGSAAADILNFGFHNIYERLDGTRKYFTAAGWDSFTEAVNNSGIIQKITEKQQVITAAPIGTPVILRSGDNPIYGKEWTVQVPIYVTVLSGKETDSRKRTLTLVLVTVPPEESLSGLGIDRWLETQ